jgi:hypothetical protein
MAATKTARTLQASASNAAGATATGTALDLTTKYGLLVTGQVTNGATGPTVACTFSIEVSNDNSVWRPFFSGTAALGNAVVTNWTVSIGPEVMYVRSKFTGNTA